ncbi:MAG TPA: hypothetical protein VMH89_02500 [Candidatus Acidoferrum sp.]|nr:hypothetical protein [Candidatus Acidoferrum sp.]
MPAPRLVILGVYRPEIPKTVYRQQWKVTGSDEQTKKHFKDLVLIEAVAEDIDDHFKMIEIGQLYTRGDYPDNFQCAYDEALLSADGQTVIERYMNCVKGSGLVRFAFYLHFYDANRPLQWSYGQIACPPVEPVSKRLKDLVPYRACD